MDRDKLIEKMNKVKSLLEASENPNTYKYEAWMSLEEVNLILTSLTAPVPDGKECEECAAKQNRIDELKAELSATVDELKDYRDSMNDLRLPRR